MHLSRELSGTWESARLAADEVGPDLVRVVDSRATGMGLGYAVLAAVDAADAGRPGAAVEAAAAEVAARCRMFFSVDTLDRLRRGGRIGTAAAVLGTALGVKPLLHVSQGRIVPLEKVRTTARAAQRLVDLAVQAAGDGPVDLAVHHLAAAARAEEVAARLGERLPRTARLLVSEVGAVIGAHVGARCTGVVVVPQSCAACLSKPDSPAGRCRGTPGFDSTERVPDSERRVESRAGRKLSPSAVEHPQVVSSAVPVCPRT